MKQFGQWTYDGEHLYCEEFLYSIHKDQLKESYWVILMEKKRWCNMEDFLEARDYILNEGTLICPDCGGDGTIVDYTTGCCRNPNEDGSCCNCPIPEPIQVQCCRCEATGFLRGAQYYNLTCSDCNGSGEVNQGESPNGGYYIEECYKCGGSGKI